MEQNQKLNIEKSQEDLDQRINAFHVQYEDAREKAFLNLVAEIIVQTTLQEYYETKKSIEV